jgi:hypothetical protein
MNHKSLNSQCAAVRATYVNNDYTQRMGLDDILAALKAIQKQT